MKKTLLILATILSCYTSHAQDKIQINSTIKIEASDTKQMIIEKAAHVVPTKNQLNALRNEFITFVHFGLNTFTRNEWGNGKEDPKIFDLKELDTDQWCEAIKAAGMKMVMLTVKHHDGFVMWQSRYTKHGIMSTDFMNGQGDVLKDLSKSCQKYGLKLGIYVSPADLYQIENPDGLYGNLSKSTTRTIPREVPNRPFANKTKFEFELDDYNEYFMNQLFELLTEYGTVHEVWFDGAHPKRKGNQQYNYLAWKKLINTLAPDAVIFGRQDIRWCGNESGATRNTEWNIIPYQENPNNMSVFADITGNVLANREKLYNAKYLHYQQAETNTSIREGWFYRDDIHQKIRSVDDVFDIYERSVGGNSTFLLNVTPNRNGHLSLNEVDVLIETGKRIKKTYGTNLLNKAKGEKTVLDNNPDTYYILNKGELTITTPTPITFNRLVLQEAIATHSERVEKHSVEAFVDGKWQKITESTNIGYKRILRFPTVTTNKIRVNVLESRLVPAISNISAHFYEARPPRLTFNSDVNGVVTIEPFKQEFGWKPHGENSAENLNSDLRIYYTTDNTEPTANSNEYTTPIKVGNTVLKAIAISNDESGAVNSEQMGIPQNRWKLFAPSSNEGNHLASNAFDSKNNTYWLSKEGGNHSISIDLGADHALKGFAYTPQTQHPKAMMSKGLIKISADGVNWKTLESFEFGNLINDPTKRYHYFNKTTNARYIQIEITEIAESGNVVAIAEIALF